MSHDGEWWGSRYGEIEYGWRKYDRKFNIWELTPQYGWLVREVQPNKASAVEAVRRLRGEPRVTRWD